MNKSFIYMMEAVSIRLRVQYQGRDNRAAIEDRGTLASEWRC